MKSHVFQMKYFLAGIYIICVIFTCFNARFYHTPLAKISSVTEKETMSRKGTRDAEEYYYTQKITARILNGCVVLPVLKLLGAHEVVFVCKAPPHVAVGGEARDDVVPVEVVLLAVHDGEAPAVVGVHNDDVGLDAALL